MAGKVNYDCSYSFASSWFRLKEGFDPSRYFKVTPLPTEQQNKQNERCNQAQRVISLTIGGMPSA